MSITKRDEPGAVWPPAVKVLVVEDDQLVRQLLVKFLAGMFGEIVVATSGREGLRLLRLEKPDIVLSDIDCAIGDGIDGEAVGQAVAELRQAGHKVALIYMSGGDGYAERELGRYTPHFVAKPFRLSRIGEVLLAAHGAVMCGRGSHQHHHEGEGACPHRGR